jgi:uncharacterized membrane protein
MSDKSSKEQEEPEEPTWTYKGYRLKSSEFVSAMAHEFRAEVQRTNIWRTRLDVTTNWAVVVTGVSISIAFSQPDTHHGVIILNALLITLFLFIEARRYRYYEMWSYRVRLMETDFFAAMLVPPFHPSPKWAENLAENILHFNFPISLWEAIGLRLRRNYLWIFLIVGIAWLAKYGLFPTPASDLTGFISRAAIGPVPGPVVVGISLAYFGFLTLVAIFTLSVTNITGEVLPRSVLDVQPKLHVKTEHIPEMIKNARNWLDPWQRQRRQFLALIITNKTDVIAKRILSEIKRGVTAVPGEESTMLICALTATEIKNLRAVVAKEDPLATVNILPAQEVLGRGFDALSGA